MDIVFLVFIEILKLSPAFSVHFSTIVAMAALAVPGFISHTLNAYVLEGPQWPNGGNVVM